MSENLNNKACPICGAENSESARFCSFCGAKLDDASNKEKLVTESVDTPQKKIEKAEKKIKKPEKKKHTEKKKTAPSENNADTKKIDNAKTESVINEELTSLTNSVKIAKMRRNPFECIASFLSKRLVGCVSVLLIAVTLIGLWFVPFAHSKAKLDNDTYYNVDYSCAKTVELSVRSFFFLNNSEIRDTKLYNDIELEASESAKFEKGFALTLMKKNTAVRVTIILTALISLAYLGLCLVLLTFSIIDLIFALISLKKKKKATRMPSAAFLCAVLCILPVLIFSFLLMCQFGMNNSLSQYSNNGVGLCVGGIISIFVAVLGGGLICIERGLNLKKPSVRFVNKTRFKNTVCLIITLIVVVSAFLPCVGIDFYNARTGEYEATVNVSPTNLYESGNAEINAYRNISKSTVYSRIVGIANNIRSGQVEVSELSDELLYAIVCGYGRLDLRVLYGFINVITMLTLLFSGILLYLFISNIFFNSSNNGAILIFKMLTLISAVLNFTIMLALTAIITSAISGQMEMLIGITLGIGPILMLLCTVALIIIPSNPKECKYVDSCYDNADVSYAPYVVDGK